MSAMPPLNAYVNGKVVPLAQATINVTDAGLEHGASVFTTACARGGVIFRLGAHLERLMHNVQQLGMVADAAPEDLTREANELLRINGLDDARVRITLTPGDRLAGRPTTIITAEPLPEYPSWWYDKGIGVIVTRYRQPTADPTVGRKTGCYLARAMARRQAQEMGMQEALWYTADGRLAEACYSNVFLVTAGQVRTPPLDTPVLGGIVRHVVLDICREEGIDASDDAALSVEDMLAAEEVFLTSSCSGIRPVVRIEKHQVGKDKPGPITQHIRAAYEKVVARECSLDSETEEVDG